MKLLQKKKNRALTCARFPRCIGKYSVKQSRDEAPDRRSGGQVAHCPALAAGSGAVDTAGCRGHFALNCIAQQLRGSDDAGRDEGEQKGVLDRGNAALVISKIAQKVTHSRVSRSSFDEPTWKELLPVPFLACPF